MGNVVQLKQVATEASDNSIVQCHIAVYRLALAENRPAISAAKTQIENDLKVIDAAMRNTDSPRIRERHGHIDNTMATDRDSPVWDQGRKRGETPMTTIQAVFMGMMLALTPSLVLLAFLVWREEVGVRQVTSDFEDQPPYPRAQ